MSFLERHITAALQLIDIPESNTPKLVNGMPKIKPREYINSKYKSRVMVS